MTRDAFNVLREALNAAAHGPFFPDWEFATLFGMERAEVAAIADAFAIDTPITGEVARALQNAVNHLLGYPHDQEAAWSQWISVTPAELEAFWRSETLRQPGA